MTATMMRLLVVVVTALTLAVGGLGVTSGIEPNAAAAAVASDGGDVSNNTKR